MNSSEFDRFRTLIRSRLAEIEAEDALGAGGQSVVELDQQSVGRLSRMDALQNQAMAKAQQARRDSEKSRLKLALQRISEEEYGYCSDCGDVISARRLELDLAAIRCISCASG